MGTFSIWHWIIVLVAFLIIFGLPVYAVYRENSNECLSRLGFLKWFGLYYLGVPIVSGLALGFFGVEDKTIEGLGSLYGIMLMYPLFQRVVRRARDAGMGKGIAYLTVIPLVNIITFLILAFKAKDAFHENNIADNIIEARLSDR